MNRYVFWRYDLYPYVLGGEATTIIRLDDKQTCAHVPSYGRPFHARHITSVAAGARMRAGLEDLREQYRKAQIQLRHEFMARALERAPFLKTFPAYRDDKDFQAYLEWRENTEVRMTP